MDEMLKTFERIYNTADGKDLVAFLENLSKETYGQWKRSPSELNDVFKGQCIVIDDLIKEFTTASDKLAKQNEVTVEKYEYTTNPSY